MSGTLNVLGSCSPLSLLVPVLAFSSDPPHCCPKGLLVIWGTWWERKGRIATQAVDDQGVGKRSHFPHQPLGKEQGQFERSFKFKLCFLVSSSSFKGKLESLFYSFCFFLLIQMIIEAILTVLERQRLLTPLPHKQLLLATSVGSLDLCCPVGWSPVACSSGRHWKCKIAGFQDSYKEGTESRSFILFILSVAVMIVWLYWAKILFDSPVCNVATRTF